MAAATRLVQLDADDIEYLAEMHGSDPAYARRLINCSTAPQRDKIMAKVALARDLGGVATIGGRTSTLGAANYGQYLEARDALLAMEKLPYDQDAAANRDYDWAPPPRPTPLGSLRFLLLAALILGGTALAVLAVTG